MHLSFIFTLLKCHTCLDDIAVLFGCVWPLGGRYALWIYLLMDVATDGLYILKQRFA